MMAKKLKKTGLSQMKAKAVGGDPVQPAHDPVKDLPGRKTVAKGKGGKKVRKAY